MTGHLTVGRAADPATEAVETTMFRALAVLRIVVLVNALALNIYRWDNVDHPAAGALVLAVITAWTGIAIWAYDQPALRRLPLLLTDLAITVGAMLVSPLVKGPEMQATIPGFWVMGVVLAWGIRGHWVGGLIASLAVSATDLAVRSDVDQGDYGNIFLLMIGGPVLGYTSGLLKEMAAARDRAEHEAAAAAERARLARVVHDGVLQVLAIVQRRGLELGGEAADLGRLAGEQEAALRALVQQGGVTPAFGTEAGDGVADLARALSAVGTRQVTVSVPGQPVELPAATVAELTAVVRACLDNVATHVGSDAPAWVLLEDLGDAVVVSVRDEGPGIPEGRLEEAEAQGRLGVCQSIRGRITDLGGTATLVTAPGQGTEWELTVPR
jgi:signal transduction histidine kinase